jgi:hypothetical protein
MYENGKMRLIETILGMGGEMDKGEWWRGWTQPWYIVRAFVKKGKYRFKESKKNEKKKYSCLLQQ